MENKKYLNKKELGKYLGCSVGYIDSLMKRKFISYYKLGKMVRFDLEEVEKDLEKYKIEIINE